ncbi:MAG: L,D-transpeptidase family protein [Lachnospiraceae bacterium]|nr:L,D-transpeptidase family protein [Lachnospiraceae bacterium]
MGNKKNSKKKKRSALKTAGIAAGCLLLCTAGAYFVNAGQYKTKFVPGTTVNGSDISDRSIEEIETSLAQDAADYTLTLRFLNDETATIASSDIKLGYSLQTGLSTILSTQNRYTWIGGLFGNSQQYDLTTDVSYDSDALEQILSALPAVSAENITAPVDANLAMDSSYRFYIVPEVNGNQIQYDNLVSAVKDALENRQTSLNLVTTVGVYDTPDVTSTNEDLIARRDSINNMLDTVVTYHMSDGTDQVLNDKITIEWLKINEDGVYVVDEDYIREKAAAYIAGLAALDDNYGYFRTFSSSWFGTVRMGTDELHGHTLDQEAMTNELTSDLTGNKTGEHSMTYSTMIDTLDPRFGGTYVEVDILNQRVFFYINYELYFECNCVTGLEGVNSTPSGIFSIINKERDRNLESYNEDGSLRYSSHVDFWMCFKPHYGLHDASWRGSFGGEIYTYDGSHGCVNLSYNSARTIYEALDYDTPVIVFRGHDEYIRPLEEDSSES